MRTDHPLRKTTTESVRHGTPPQSQHPHVPSTKRLSNWEEEEDWTVDSGQSRPIEQHPETMEQPFVRHVSSVEVHLVAAAMTEAK